MWIPFLCVWNSQPMMLDLHKTKFLRYLWVSNISKDMEFISLPVTIFLAKKPLTQQYSSQPSSENILLFNANYIKDFKSILDLVTVWESIQTNFCLLLNSFQLKKRIMSLFIRISFLQILKYYIFDAYKTIRVTNAIINTSPHMATSCKSKYNVNECIALTVCIL